MCIGIRTCTNIISSLKTSAFQVVLARDGRGLAYRVRKDILTNGRLLQTPITAPGPREPRGRLKTNCGKLWCS
jgi:hypothetical protein